MSDSYPRVSLVGAGPGHPGLLTLRAVECLGQADLILYDKLVPQRILDYAPLSSERICVADLPGPHPERGPHIHRLMIGAVRQGRRVVRLKGGDPFLFARGGEEAQALSDAGVAYEIVPGVSAGPAAAAFAGIPLTHRLHASAVAFITGHEDPNKPDNNLDWRALAQFPGTLVIYMGMSRLGQLVQALLENGKSPTTPTAVIQWGTTGDQRTIETRLAGVVAAAHDAGMHAPAIVVIGSVVSLRRQLAWFEKRPLFGKHIIVTRPRAQSADLARRLEQLGAVPHVLPVVEVGEPADWGPADRALLNLAAYQWLVFTSGNGVHAVVSRLRKLGRDLRALGPLQLAVIGPGTAEALRAHNLEPDLMPAEYRSESLAAALKERVAGRRILLARADRGREILRDELAAVATVEQIVVYSQTDAVETNAELLHRLGEGKINYVTLTSSNIARAFLRGLDTSCRSRIEARQVELVTISPVTSATVRDMGFPVAAEATEYTTSGVVEALIRLSGRALPEVT
jgi:uroporphyrinogen III methyltransferase/synthase